MKTKHYFLPLRVALFATCLTFVSCNERDDLETQNTEYVNVTINLNTPRTVSSAMLGTKASGDNHGNEAKDKTIDTLQIFVFNSDGQIEAYKCFSGKELSANNKYTMTVSTGLKQVYAVANSHNVTSFASVKSVEEMNALTVSLSRENALNFSMKGFDDISVESDKANEVTLEMTRFVSRVHIGTVKTAFDGAFSECSLSDVELYLTNVYSESKLSDMVGKSGTVINADTLVVNDFEGYAMDGIVYEQLSDITSEGVEYDKYLYCYSNPGTAKSTRLIIRALLDSVEYFYPISISDGIQTKSLAPNTAIDISSVTIKRPGSKSPSEDVSYEDIEFTITVNDWTKLPVQNIEF